MPYRNTARRPAGYVVSVGPDGPDQEFDTLQCCHCNRHFRVRPDKGGFCMICMAPICDSARCDHCLPFERRLSMYEKGLIGSL